MNSFNLPQSYNLPEPQFSIEEDKKIIFECKEKVKNWKKIHQKLYPTNKVSKLQLIKRYKQLTSNNVQSVNKGLWSLEEDEKLKLLVNQFGAEKWVQIASLIKTRNGKQCRERWHNHLNPSINKLPFTQKEEELILNLYSKLGSKWSEISKYLPNRSDNSIKNFFNTTLQKKRKILKPVNNILTPPFTPEFNNQGYSPKIFSNQTYSPNLPSQFQLLENFEPKRLKLNSCTLPSINTIFDESILSLPKLERSSPLIDNHKPSLPSPRFLLNETGSNQLGLFGLSNHF